MAASSMRFESCRREELRRPLRMRSCGSTDRHWRQLPPFCRIGLVRAWWAWRPKIVDRDKYSQYAAAGLSPFYIRNYPQFNLLFVGTNDGRSYYDSLQLRVRRRTVSAEFDTHYTFSKTIDLLSNAGAAQDHVIDHFNLRLNRARADFDRAHVLSGSA